MIVKWTKRICLCVTAGVILYDIPVAIWGPSGSTVSEVVRNWAYYQPIWPFAWGVVLGHWFWSKK